MSSLLRLRLFAVVILMLCVAVGHAQIPALNSRAGAAYTIYLDFGGFNFNGTWGNTGASPGATPAFGNTAQIREVWARTAEKYAAFNINVTTVDPAIAAGKAGSDSTRQRYYDNTARLMHTVVGGSGSWWGGGGVSYIGVTASNYTGTGFTNGLHTNFVFPSALGNGTKYIAEASGHENGHGLGLDHQADYRVNGTINNEYSSNGGASGNGSYAPIMGNSYNSQRGTWRVGTLTDGTIQNDVKVLLSNPGFSLISTGIGNSFATATQLALSGTTVDSTLSKGIIRPLSSSSPNPIGINNYTKDYFKFTMAQPGNVTLRIDNGGDWLTPGTASAGATLRSRLNIFRAADLLNSYASATEAADTMSSTFSGNLSAGVYYAEITSYGGYQSTYDATAKYYDMGSYILSGSGFLTGPVVTPEPGTAAFLGFCLFGIAPIVRKRKRVRRDHSLNR